MNRRDFVRGFGGMVTAAVVAGHAGGKPVSAGEALDGLAMPVPAFAEREEVRNGLKIHIGPLRVVMRGPMFPSMARFGEETVLLFAQAVEEGGPLTAIRSEDGGVEWRACAPEIDGMGLNTMRLRSGRAVSLHYDTQPIEGRAGYRRTRRWESPDLWKTVEGPIEDGEVFLPADQFKEDAWQWFHGNMVEMPDDSLLAVMQGIHEPSRFRTYLSRSGDHGKTWEFVSHVASLDAIDDREGTTKTGWTLWGPCEPYLVHLGENRLVCVMRLVNDDHKPLMAEPRETYHDLSYTVPGDGIHPGTLPADQFYTIGPPSAPLVISFSPDGGTTWTPAKPMRQGRGCFPRMALSDGILALTYGGLAYPRWGNAITFSTDGGQSWTDEVVFAPFLTTGYTDIIVTGPRRFLAVFDCTPPQPWKNHAAHWVGAADITVS